MPPDAFLDRFLPSHSISIPEDTPSFKEGMLASMLPPSDATGVTGAAGGTGTAHETGAAGATDATGVSGATKPYCAIVRPSWSMA